MNTLPVGIHFLRISGVLQMLQTILEQEKRNYTEERSIIVEEQREIRRIEKLYPKSTIQLEKLKDFVGRHYELQDKFVNEMLSEANSALKIAKNKQLFGLY